MIAFLVFKVLIKLPIVVGYFSISLTNGSFISVEKDTLKRKSIPFEYKAQDYFGMIS